MKASCRGHPAASRRCAAVVVGAPGDRARAHRGLARSSDFGEERRLCRGGPLRSLRPSRLVALEPSRAAERRVSARSRLTSRSRSDIGRPPRPCDHRPRRSMPARQSGAGRPAPSSACRRRRSRSSRRCAPPVRAARHAGSSILICSLTSPGRPSAARSKAAMLSSKREGLGDQRLEVDLAGRDHAIARS